jgi:hypothetical protein
MPFARFENFSLPVSEGVAIGVQYGNTRIYQML